MANAFGYYFTQDFTIDDPTPPADEAFYFPDQCPDFADVNPGEPIRYFDFQSAHAGWIGVTVAWQANPALIGLYTRIKADFVAARDGLSKGRCWFWFYHSGIAEYVVASGIMTDPEQTNFLAGGDLVDGLKIRFSRLFLHQTQHQLGKDYMKIAQAKDTMIIIGDEDFSDNEDWIYG